MDNDRHRVRTRAIRRRRRLARTLAVLALLVTVLVVVTSSHHGGSTQAAGPLPVVPASPPASGCGVTVDGHTVQVTQAVAQAASEVGDAARASKRPLTSRQINAMARSIVGEQHVPEATAEQLAAAFGDGAPAAVSCAPVQRLRALPVQPALNKNGLTQRAQALFDAARAAHGRIGYGGFAPGGVHSGHMAGSAHYEGRAVDFFFDPMNTGNHQRAWAFANWAVANADRLDIDNVIFDGMIWASDHGYWRPYVRADGKTDATSMHRDHVHVDVLRGTPIAR